MILYYFFQQAKNIYFGYWKSTFLLVLRNTFSLYIRFFFQSSFFNLQKSSASTLNSRCSRPFHHFESGHWSGSCFGGQALPIAWLWLVFMLSLQFHPRMLICLPGSWQVLARQKSPSSGPRLWSHQVPGRFLLSLVKVGLQTSEKIKWFSGKT